MVELRLKMTLESNLTEEEKKPGFTELCLREENVLFGIEIDNEHEFILEKNIDKIMEIMELTGAYPDFHSRKDEIRKSLFRLYSKIEQIDPKAEIFEILKNSGAFGGWDLIEKSREADIKLILDPTLINSEAETKTGYIDEIRTSIFEKLINYYDVTNEETHEFIDILANCEPSMIGKILHRLYSPVEHPTEMLSRTEEKYRFNLLNPRKKEIMKDFLRRIPEIPILLDYKGGRGTLDVLQAAITHIDSNAEDISPMDIAAIQSYEEYKSAILYLLSNVQKGLIELNDVSEGDLRIYLDYLEENVFKTFKWTEYDKVGPIFFGVKPKGSDLEGVSSYGHSGFDFMELAQIINNAKSKEPELTRLSSTDYQKKLGEIVEKELEIRNLKLPGYNLVEEIGRGSYKKVYLAEHEELPGMQFALLVTNVKEVSEKGRHYLEKLGRTALENCRGEANKLAKINFLGNPHLPMILSPPVYDEKKNIYYWIEEYVEKRLSDILEDNPPSFYTSLCLINQIANAINEVNGKLNYFHGDLSFNNIGLKINEAPSPKIRAVPEAKVLDWGLCSTIPEHSKFYDEREFLGDRLSRAPEVWDKKVPTEKADYWAVGIIAYRLLTGEYPFNWSFEGTKEEWSRLSVEQKQVYEKEIHEKIKEYCRRPGELKKTMRERIFELNPQDFPAEDFVKKDVVNFIYNCLERSPSKRILEIPSWMDTERDSFLGGGLARRVDIARFLPE